jgi:hypothetical protein
MVMLTDQERHESMAAARHWRDANYRCRRCYGKGLIATWGGLAGAGGKIGPCPRCQKDGAEQFVRRLARETFNKGE